MSRSMLPKGILPLLILVVGIVGAVLMIKLKPQPPKRPAPVHRPVVRVERVDGATPEVVVTGHGSVAARRRITVVPQVSGVVTETSPAFQSGGVFTEGEVLLRIDEADWSLAVETARAQVAKAEYDLATADQEAQIARREWERIRAEEPDTLVRPNPLVLHGPQLELARAQLASARAGLAQAELNLARCTVRAPFAGRVVEESVSEGQYLRAGNPVGTIYATDVAEVSVPLRDEDLAFFAAPDADGAGGAAAELVAEFAGREHVWQGRVVRLSGALDPETRLVDAVVAVDDGYAAADGRPALLDGLFVEVRIHGRSLPGMVAVPRSALREDDRLWVVDGDGRLRVRQAEVVRADRESAVISAGVRPGEEVVVSQLEVVVDGMVVRVAGRDDAPEVADRDGDAAPATAGERGGDS